jgi:hypothetical protein
MAGRSGRMHGLLEAICLIAALFALIALMPKFDGTRDEDWERRPGDGRKR